MNKRLRKAFGSIKGGNRRDLVQALELAKGETAESRTIILLNGPSRPKWLLEARATPEKDMHGIDIELHLADGKTIVPINIKSSKEGLFKHIKKRKEIKGKFVAVLIVLPRDTDEQILKNLARTLRRYKLGKDRHNKKIKRAEKKKHEIK